VEARRQAEQSSGVRGGAGDGAQGCVSSLLVSGKAEDGASKDARAAPNRGGRSRTGTRRHQRPYESSLLEMGRRERSLKSKDKASLPFCQASGREVRIIYRRVGECQPRAHPASRILTREVHLLFQSVNQCHATASGFVLSHSVPHWMRRRHGANCLYMSMLSEMGKSWGQRPNSRDAKRTDAGNRLHRLEPQHGLLETDPLEQCYKPCATSRVYEKVVGKERKREYPHL